MLSGRGICDEAITRPIECGVSECDREASIMRQSWSTGEGGGGLLRMEKNNYYV